MTAPEIIGHRALFRVGSELLPLFDDERRPQLLDTGVRLDLRFEPADPKTFGDLERAPWPGKVVAWGDLEPVWSAPALWGPVPHAFPRVKALSETETPDEAAKLSVAAPDCSGLADLWVSLEQARAADRLGLDPVTAWQESARCADAIGAPTERARRLGVAAYFATWRGDFALSQRLLDEADSIAPGLGDCRISAHIDYNRGLLDRSLGDPSSAQRHFERALEGGKRCREPRWAALPARMLAATYVLLSRPELALDVVHELSSLVDPDVPIEDQSGFENDLGWIKLNAYVELAPESLPEAVEHFERAVAMNRRLDEPRKLSVNYANLAFARLILGHRAEAEEALVSFDALAEHARPAELNFADLVRGRLALAEGRFRRATEAFLRIEQRSVDLMGGGLAEWKSQVAHGLGLIAVEVGDHAAAQDQFDRALRERSLAAARVSIQQSRAGFRSDRIQVVIDAMEHAVRRRDLERAFAIADAEQGALIQTLDGRVRRQRLSRAQRDELTRRLTDYQQARSRFEDARDELRSLSGRARRDAAKARQRERKSLADQFDRLNAYLDRVAPLLPVLTSSVGALWQVLERDEAMVLFAPGSEPPTVVRAGEPDSQPMGAGRPASVGRDWHAFLLKKGELRHQRLSATDDPIAGFRDSLSDVGHLYVVAGGWSRAQQVHLPVVAVPRGSVRPSSARKQAAAGSGSDPRGQHPWILEQASVSYLPHAGFLLKTRSVPDGSPLIVANPTGDLPHAQTEGRLVSRFVPAARLLEGDEATRSAVLQALDGAGSFHFSGHGELPPGQPWDHHLRLAADEQLGLEDLLVAQPRVGFVVLSGCETGQRGQLSRLSGVGLADGFLAVGAETVIATDQRIRDEDGLRVIEAFYRAGGQERPAAAMQAVARAEEAAGRSAWRAFRVLGRR